MRCLRKRRRICLSTGITIRFRNTLLGYYQEILPFIILPNEKPVDTLYTVNNFNAVQLLAQSPGRSIIAGANIPEQITKWIF